MDKKTLITILNRLAPDPEIGIRLAQTIPEKAAEKKKQQRKRVWITAASLSLILLLGLPFLIPFFTKSPSISGGFVITAYAVSPPSTASPDEEKTVPTPLTPDAKILLPAYSLLMSSVPGYPFTILWNASTDSCDYIQASVDFGEILLWDAHTGKVTPQGSRTACLSGETIYWSPLEENTTAQLPAVSAKLSLSAIHNGRVLGQTQVTIQVDDSSALPRYTATLAK